MPETTQKDRIPTLDGPALDPGSEMHVVGKLLDCLICFGSFWEGFLCFFDWDGMSMFYIVLLCFIDLYISLLYVNLHVNSGI